MLSIPCFLHTKVEGWPDATFDGILLRPQKSTHVFDVKMCIIHKAKKIKCYRSGEKK